MAPNEAPASQDLVRRVRLNAHRIEPQALAEFKRLTIRLRRHVQRRG
jgi:hypothetical protein